MKIKAEDRFSNAELLDMFTWDTKPKTRRKRVARDTRGFKKACQPYDNIRSGVTVHPPGSSQRLADLKAFYDIATKFDEPISPFEEQF